MMDAGRISSTKYWPKTWQARKIAVRFVSMMRAYSSSEISRNGVGELVPAPLIRMSTPPDFSKTVSSMSWSDWREVTSTGTK